jgi:hypothetical protein
MKTIAAILILTYSVSLHAAPFNYDYTIPCDDTQLIMSSLKDNHREELSWAGTHIDDNSTYSLWVNDSKGTWTLLKMNPEISCVLGVGLTNEKPSN